MCIMHMKMVKVFNKRLPYELDLIYAYPLKWSKLHFSQYSSWKCYKTRAVAKTIKKSLAHNKSFQCTTHRPLNAVYMDIIKYHMEINMSTMECVATAVILWTQFKLWCGHIYNSVETVSDCDDGLVFFPCNWFFSSETAFH